jgi:hypothetical protein
MMKCQKDLFSLLFSHYSFVSPRTFNPVACQAPLNLEHVGVEEHIAAADFAESLPQSL